MKGGVSVQAGNGTCFSHILLETIEEQLVPVLERHPSS